MTITYYRPTLGLELPELQAEILRLLGAHARSGQQLPRRSMVERYVLLEAERVQHQDLARAALSGGLRRQVALALLALQQLGLVAFDPHGMLLTDDGEKRLQEMQGEDGGHQRQDHADTIVRRVQDYLNA